MIAQISSSGAADARIMEMDNDFSQESVVNITAGLTDFSNSQRMHYFGATSQAVFGVKLDVKDLWTYPAQTGVANEEDPLLAESFKLNQNYPNPFNPSTVISYQLPASGKVTLKVYDLLGQEVATLVNTTMSAGAHEVSFDASRLASGMYIYRIQSGNFIQTRKMLLVK